MTPFNLLLRLTGLSQREARDFLKISKSSVEKMASGIIPTPDGIIEELRALNSRQYRAAGEAIKIINEQAESDNPPEIIALRLAATDDEAQSPSFGWPCVGAHAGMLAFVVAACPGKRFIIL